MIVLQGLVAVFIAEIAALALFGGSYMCVVGEIETALLQLVACGPCIFCRHQLFEDLAVALQDAVDAPYVDVDAAVDLVVVAVPAEIGTKFFIHPSAEGVSAFMTFPVHK
jgi:hypothetical protein